MISRRLLLGGAAAAVRLSARPAPDPAELKDQVLAGIHPPHFPDRVFDIARFGATVEKDSSDAIGKAVAACVQAGGGTVLIPRGVFPTGPIHLRSNVNLRLEEGALGLAIPSFRRTGWPGPRPASPNRVDRRSSNS